MLLLALALALTFGAGTIMAGGSGIGGVSVARAATSGTCDPSSDTCGFNCGAGDQAADCGSLVVRHSDRVQHHPLVYIVAWGSGWGSDPNNLPGTIEAFMRSLAGTQWNNILSIYNDGTDFVHNDVTVGARYYYDTKNVVPFVLTMNDINTEANRALAANPTWTVTGDTDVLVMPQPGSTYATSGGIEPWTLIPGCGQHQLTATDNRVTASVLVYPGDGGCGALGTMDTVHLQQYYTEIAGHEYAESATDPTGPGYPLFHPTWGWSTVNPTSDPIEVGDQCQGWSFPDTADPYLTGGNWAPPRIWDKNRTACVQAVGQDFPSPDYSGPYHGVHTVQGAILGRYQALRTTSSAVGEPTTEEQNAPGGGRESLFNGSSCGSGSAILSTGPTGAWEMHGCIYNDYLHKAGFGGPAGQFGYPVSNEQETVSNNGRVNYMSGSPCGGNAEPHSALYFNGATWGVKGCIFKQYLSMGETKSFLGYPASLEYSTSPGIRQDFQGGYMLWANGVATPYRYGCTDYGGTTMTGPNACVGFYTTSIWFSGGGVGWFGQEIWTYANGTVKDSTANYTLHGLDTTRAYTLQAYIPNNHSDAAHAHYHYCGTNQGCADGYVNQNNYGNAWANFGTVCTTDGTATIQLADDGGDVYPAQVGADAIRAVRTGIVC